MNGQQIKNGVLGSLAGGVVMGIPMQMMGSIKMVAMMVGSESALIGWIVHLLISALFGVAYAILFGKQQTQWLTGLIYGFIWYLLGPLTLMPLFMGMGVQWSATAVAGSLSSLMSHLVYGLVTGLVYQALEKREAASTATGPSHSAR
ncbi:MAG: hypothetical protein ACOY94_00475 [Bacillota bacterium]